jgi:CHAP domain
VFAAGEKAMRQLGTALVAVVGSALLVVIGAGCAMSGPGFGSEQSPTSSGSSSEAGATSNGNGSTQGDDGGVAPAPGTGNGVDSGADATPVGSADAGSDAPSGATPFSCTGAGIAAYADALVVAARQSCTADGVGVVDDTDYSCMQAPIQQLNPPYAGASYNVVSTLLAGDTQYPFLECTYFVQAVTAGVCGAPISPPSTPWTDYPLAYTFAGQSIPGYTWIPNAQGQSVQVGDIHVYESTYQGDPGHIMIVAAVVDSTHFRLDEANELNSDGSDATMETGVVSNTRVDSLDNTLLAGWFRVNP